MTTHDYHQLAQQAQTCPEQYWAQATSLISWQRDADSVLDDSNKPFYQWFKGGVLNTCFNAVDRHVLDGYGDEIAIIYDSPVTDTKQQISYLELQHQVSKLAGAMAALGGRKGDRVVIYMPMIPNQYLYWLHLRVLNLTEWCNISPY